jgi:DNA mismatch endonuclease, patch repair protein
MMSGIRGKNTKPEVRVRSYLHRAGFRFRLHPRGLPGRPDLVLPRYRTAVFIHGCFWHRHPGCRFAYTPKSNLPFWQKKFDENVARDLVKARELRSQGWRVRVIWECQTRDESQLAKLARAISRGITR